MPSTFAKTRYGVAVIGGGQAGLSASWCLTQRGIDHVVIERHEIGHSWRTQRWDSFCLVTPNWQCRLPGFPYQGQDPFGFMVKDDIVRYIEDYAASFSPPLVAGVSVARVSRDGPGFRIETDAGTIAADQVIVAVGGYHTPRIPVLAKNLPRTITQLHSCEYRNPHVLPDGAVLVIGTGQSGCQIAEDLHLAGRQVHLATGSAPRTARRYRGRDVVEWLDDMGHYDLPVDQHPLGEKVRLKANHYVTGRDGGRDIDLRRFAHEGMQLYGRLRAVEPGLVRFGDDLAANLDRADASSEAIKDQIDSWIAKHGIDAAEEERYRPLWTPPAPPPDTLDIEASGLAAVVWSTGFHADFSWIEAPVFQPDRKPAHKRGVTAEPGLYFLGLPWLYSWGSGRFSGIARDATFVVDDIASQRASAAAAA